MKVVKHWNWDPSRLGHLSPHKHPKWDRPSPGTTWSGLELGPALSRGLGCVTSRGPVWPQSLCDSKKLDPNCWTKPDTQLHFRKELRVKIQKASGENKINQTIPGPHSDGKIPTESNCPCDSPLAPLPFRKGRGERDELCGSVLLAYSKVDT